MKNLKSKQWWDAASTRMIKTMAQVAGSLLVIGLFKENAWDVLFQTSLLAGVGSLLTSLAGLPEVDE